MTATSSNAYITGIGTTLATNFKLSGQATIAPGWSAGYLIHIEANSGDTFVNNQFSDESTRVDLPDVGFGTRTLQSYWWVKSDHYGKVSLGRLSQASDNTAILVDGSGSLVPANWVLFEGSSFFLRNANIANALGGPFAGRHQLRQLHSVRLGRHRPLRSDEPRHRCGLQRRASERHPLRLADLRRLLGVGIVG